MSWSSDCVSRDPGVSSCPPWSRYAAKAWRLAANIGFVHGCGVRQFGHQSQIPRAEFADPSPQALLFGGVIRDVFEAVKCGTLLSKFG